MLGLASEHGLPDEPRAITRTRAGRGVETQLVPGDLEVENLDVTTEPVADVAGRSSDLRDFSMEGVVETRHVTNSGREYSTFRFDGGFYRSKAALLRNLGIRGHDNLPPTPLPQPTVAQGFLSVPPASSSRRKRESEPSSYVDFDPTGRCGNPACVVPATSSRDPYHEGLCVFAVEPRRRRA